MGFSSSGAMQGAAAGSALGPWGMAGGAIIGGFAGDLFGGGTNKFQAQLDPGILGQQEAFTSALMAQANGTGGPNLGQAQLNLATNATMQNAAAIAAAQRGVSPALAARQAQEAAGTANQQAAGQSALINAQTQLATQQLVGQQLNTQQSQKLAAQGINAPISQANANYQGQVLGGALNGLGAAGALYNTQNNANTATPATTTASPTTGTGYLGLNTSNLGNAQYMGNSYAEGGEVKPDLKPWQIPTYGNSVIQGDSNQAGGPQDATNIPDAFRMKAAYGGMSMKQGGDVPGKANVPGNSYANDTVPAMLSPHEIVIPRSITQGKNPGEGAKKFVEDTLKKKETPKKKFADGGEVSGDTKFTPSDMNAYKAALAKIESGKSPDPYSAQNQKGSSAYGKYQFMPTTWADYSSNDLQSATPQEQETVAGKHINSLFKQFVKDNGRKPTTGEMGAMWNQGYAGFKNLSQNPHALATDVVNPQNVTSNMGTKNMSAQEYVNKLTNVYGGGAQTQPTVDPMHPDQNGVPYYLAKNVTPSPLQQMIAPDYTKQQDLSNVQNYAPSTADLKSPFPYVSDEQWQKMTPDVRLAAQNPLLAEKTFNPSIINKAIDKFGPASASQITPQEAQQMQQAGIGQVPTNGQPSLDQAEPQYTGTQLPPMADQQRPQAPNLTNPYDQMINDIQGGYQQQQAGMQQQVNAQSDLAKQQAALYHQQALNTQKLQNDYQMRVQDMMNQIDQTTNEIAKSNIDPNRLMGKMDTMNKIGLFGSLIASGIGSAIARQPSMAMDMLNKYIDNDIEAQKANLANKNNLLKANLLKFDTMDHAMAVTKANMLDIMSNKFLEQSANAASPIEKARFKQMSGQLKIEAAKTIQPIVAQKQMIDMMQRAQSPEALIDAMEFINPDRAKQMRTRLVPGKGLANREVPTDAMDEMTERKQLDRSLNALDAFARENKGSLDPAKIAYGTALAQNVQDLYRKANSQKRFSSAEQGFVSEFINTNPTKFFNDWTSRPKYKAAIQMNKALLNSKYSEYGLQPDFDFKQYEKPAVGK